MGRGTGNPVSGWRAALSPNIGYLSIQPDNSTLHSRAHTSESGLGDIHPDGHPHTGACSAPYTGVGDSSHHSNQTFSDCKPNSLKDTPYIPPRQHQSVTPQVYPHSGPHATSSYDPLRYQGSVQTYLYDGKKPTPSESQLSVDSNHSTNSTVSSSDLSVSHRGHCDLPYSQSSVEYTQQQVPLPHSASQRQPYCHFSPYQGRHRVCLETVNYGDHSPNIPGTHRYHVTFPGYHLSNNILAPETFDQLVSHKHPSSRMDYLPSSNSDPSSSATRYQGSTPTFSVSPPATGRGSLFPDAGPYLRQQLGLQPHEPVNLWSLSDPPPGEKPNQPYPMLIKLAIYGSPNKQLTLQEIYSELERRFTWFRAHRNERAWKNSIRHNLSLNKVFRPVPRPITDPGKGSYWQLDVSGGEGYKRPRKRRNRASKATPSDDDDDEDTSELDDETEGSNPETRPQSVPGYPSQYSVTLSQGMSGSRFPTDNTVIDPELRGESGHLVGEGRARPGSRRTNSAGSPYPSVMPSPRNLHTTTLENLDLSSYSQPIWSSESYFVRTPHQSEQVHGQSSGRASSDPVPTGHEYPMSVSGALPRQMPPQPTSNVPAIYRPSLGPGLEYGCEPGHFMANAQVMQGYAGHALSVSPTHGRSQVHSRLPSSEQPPPFTANTTTSSSSEFFSQSWDSAANSKGKGRAI